MAKVFFFFLKKFRTREILLKRSRLMRGLWKLCDIVANV